MYPSHPTPEAEGSTDKASLVFGVAMFGLQMWGWEHYNRKCTLPTPGHKRLKDAPSQMLGV